LNRYQTPAFADESISCERCHGPGEAHERLPGVGSIINPAKLAGAARVSICEQCHLAGEVRISNPGKSIADFQRGQLLEDTYTIYIAAQPAGGTLKVISHSEQFWRSASAPKRALASCGAVRVTILMKRRHNMKRNNRRRTSGTAV